ncbi:MAG: hypothetical protein PWP23_1334 [Candidatus Sumerlaeota bacterium]|nr:hypothetical protein [Candidatus Sumerlaeota bacterium]
MVRACPHCGHQNAPDTLRCGQCGTELELPPPQPEAADLPTWRPPSGSSGAVPVAPENLTPWPVPKPKEHVGQTPWPVHQPLGPQATPPGASSQALPPNNIVPPRPDDPEQTWREPGAAAGGASGRVRKVRKVVRLKPKQPSMDDPTADDAPAADGSDPPSKAAKKRSAPTPPPEEEDAPIVPRILFEEEIQPPPPPPAVEQPHPSQASGDAHVLAESSFHPVADWWKRGMAFAIDTGACLLMGIFFLCFSILVAPSKPATNVGGPGNMAEHAQVEKRADWQTGVTYLMWVALCMAYFGLMTMRTGQTIGKRIIRLRVVNADDSESEGPSGLFHGILAGLCFAIPCFWPFAIAAGIMAAVMPTRQTLHDMATKTKVIDESREALA